MLCHHVRHTCLGSLGEITSIAFSFKLRPITALIA